MHKQLLNAKISGLLKRFGNIHSSASLRIADRCNIGNTEQ